MSDDGCAAKVIEHLTNMGMQNAAQIVEDACGRFKSGRTPGKLRGWATLQVVRSGGWLKDGPGYMNGGVVKPGQVIGVDITDFNGKSYLAYGREAR